MENETKTINEINGIGLAKRVSEAIEAYSALIDLTQEEKKYLYFLFEANNFPIGHVANITEKVGMLQMLQVCTAISIPRIRIDKTNVTLQ